MHEDYGITIIIIIIIGVPHCEVSGSICLLGGFLWCAVPPTAQTHTGPSETHKPTVHGSRRPVGHVLDVFSLLV